MIPTYIDCFHKERQKVQILFRKMENYSNVSVLKHYLNYPANIGSNMAYCTGLFAKWSSRSKYLDEIMCTSFYTNASYQICEIFTHKIVRLRGGNQVLF